MKKLFLVLICGSLMGFSTCLDNTQVFLQQVDDTIHGDHSYTITWKGIEGTYWEGDVTNSTRWNGIPGWWEGDATNPKD